MENKIIVSFGEIMLRLTPEDDDLMQSARHFRAFYGGSESNALVCLSTLGNKTEFITALPNNVLGAAAAQHLRSYGVGLSHVIYTQNRLGVYYLEEGKGERPSSVLYDRKYSAFAHLEPEDFDYEALFHNCSLFHVSGISLAISSVTTKLIREAKKRGITVSFDFNYRSKLWSIQEAAMMYKQVLPLVDIVFGARRDIEEFLDVTEETFFKVYPEKTLVLRERQILSPDKHIVSVTAYRQVDELIHRTKQMHTQFHVDERIGTGDAFVAGVLHVLNKEPHQLTKAMEYGLACFVLKHSVPGDALTLDKQTIEHFMHNQSKDVNR